MRKIWLLTVGLVLGMMCASYADVPKTINFQGRLTNAQGALLGDNNYSVTYSLYTQETGGAPIWNEVLSTPTKNGYFNVVFGVNPSFPLPVEKMNAQLWVGIKVGGDNEMTPRFLLSSSPYALNVVDGSIDRSKMVAGAVGTTTLADGSVTLTKLSGGDGVRPGTIIMWNSATCPTGYTRLTAFDGMFPRGAATYGGTAGSDTHSHGGATGAAGSHSHTYSTTAPASGDWVDMQQGGGGSVYGNSGKNHTHSVSGSTSADGSHAHSISADSNIPRYFNVVFCRKD